MIWGYPYFWNHPYGEWIIDDAVFEKICQVVKLSVLGGQYDSHSLTCQQCCSDRHQGKPYLPHCPLSKWFRTLQIHKYTKNRCIKLPVSIVYFKIHFTFLWYKQFGSIWIIWYMIPAEIRCCSTPRLANRSQTSPVWPGNVTSTGEGRGATIYTLAPKGEANH